MTEICLQGYMELSKIIKLLLLLPLMVAFSVSAFTAETLYLTVDSLFSLGISGR